MADVVEAIIGAAFLTGGQDVALSTVKALGLQLPRVQQWLDFQQETDHVPKGLIEVPQTSLAVVEAKLGCHFSSTQVLSQALVCLRHDRFQSGGLNMPTRLLHLRTDIIINDWSSLVMRFWTFVCNAWSSSSVY